MQRLREYSCMSGHSKWSQIKRQKGAADIKRGQTFTKIANAITIAVRQGGGISDPNQNFRLRLAIEKARVVNMPKENVQRAIEKATGKGEKTEGLEEVRYEAIGPKGIALIVEGVTDNKLRTAGEIRNLLEKNGFTSVAPGSVLYQFEPRGSISLKRDNKTIDEIFMLAADAGGQDIKEAGEDVIIYTLPQDLARVREALQKELTITDAKLTLTPKLIVALTDEEGRHLDTVLQALENLNDVQEVYTNAVLSNGGE